MSRSILVEVMCWSMRLIARRHYSSLGLYQSRARSGLCQRSMSGLDSESQRGVRRFRSD